MKMKIFMSITALLLLFAMAATASAVSVTRDLPDSAVAAGADFSVSISPTGFFVAGTVTEVLPSGYTYVAGSATPVDDATYNSATRTLVLKIDAATTTVTYSVTAGTATDTFTGTYATIDASADPVTGAVTGDTTVTISGGSAPTVSVTRDLPDSAVAAGADFSVSISPTGFFVAGTVTEVLPSGYTYVAGSATPVDDATYNSATRTLVLKIDAATTTVTYSVTAGTATDTFTGTYATIDASADPVTGAVTGDTTVTIGDAPTVSVTRDLPDSAVVAGTDFSVSISPTGFFVAGTVTEMLPSGYTYVAGSATPVDGAVYNSATRTLELQIDAATPTVTYSVTAGTATDTFTGTYATIDASADPVTGAVTGDTTVTIGVLDDDPVVILIYPTDGEELSGDVTLNASAIADPDGSIVSVVFYYSDDDGSTWTEIGTGAASGIYYTCAWDTKTVDNGDYKVKAVAEDDLTGTGAGEDESDVSIDNGFCLQLEAGLNFVSIPKTLDGSNVAETVFSIASYDGEFCLYYDAATGSYDTNPLVKQCRGYWVYKNAATPICVSFDDTAAGSSQQLYVGWNMIGHIDTEEMPIYETGNDADFGSMTGLEDPEDTKLFRQVNTYTQDAGWTNYPAGDLTEMTSGTGYWILMKNGVEMFGMP